MILRWQEDTEEAQETLWWIGKNNDEIPENANRKQQRTEITNGECDAMPTENEKKAINTNVNKKRIRKR